MVVTEAKRDKGLVALYLADFFELLFLGKVGTVVALAAYFDESGTHDSSPIVCMAGYVADVKQWVHFDRDWTERLNRDCARYGIECFHATDYQARQGGFEKMTDEQRASLLPSLISLINIRVSKSFGAAFLMEDYQAVIAPYKDNFGRGPWGLCVIMCMVMVNAWAEDNDLHEPIAYMFEQGQRYSGQIVEAFNNTTEAFRRECRIGPVSLGDRRQFTPLQAADILAYETYKHNYNLLKRPEIPFRKSLDALLKVNPVEYYATREDLQVFLSSLPPEVLKPSVK